MNASVLAIRAITSQYALRLVQPLLWIGAGIYILLMVIIGWIASVSSDWWWLLAIIPTVVAALGAAAWVTVYLLAKRLAPEMNRKRTAATKKFIKHIDKVAEQAATPRFVIIGRVIKDVVVRPTSGKTFIGEIAQEPGEMRRDFDELRSLF